jgi:hypothetical protein
MRASEAEAAVTAARLKSERLSEPLTNAVARQYCIEKRACISSAGAGYARVVECDCALLTINGEADGERHLVLHSVIVMYGSEPPKGGEMRI